MFVFVLPVSLDCPFLFDSSVFSNIYLHSIAEDGVEKMFKLFSRVAMKFLWLMAR
jgi:hypothetical protein